MTDTAPFSPDDHQAESALVLSGDPFCWQAPQPTGLTIGVFDGMHRGHQQGIARLVVEAERLSLLPTVLTFSVHPLSTLAPDRAPLQLTPLSVRLEMFEQLGVRLIGLLPFDQIRTLSAPDFFQQILLDRLQTRHISVGADFRFGHQRQGDLVWLRTQGERAGIGVSEWEMVEDERGLISSSRIRDLLAKGEITQVNRLLGHPYRIIGQVKRGDQRGVTLGFPTANVSDLTGIALPPAGVYAGWADLPQGTFPTVINIGVRPTFRADGSTVVEAHLLDFEGDLYGVALNLRLVDRLRSEQKFDTPTDLVSQINHDIAQARQLLHLDPAGR